MLQGRQRAGYGEQPIEQLSLDLTGQFGRGFSRQNLQQMRSFFLAGLIRQTASGESPRLPKPEHVSGGAGTECTHDWTGVGKRPSEMRR